jgi:hypothetical protein
MNLFYTVDGACFFIVDNVVEMILSAEGVRMGCPLGSFRFDLALQDVLERCVQSQGAAGMVLRSPTYDCNLALQLPDDPAQAHATSPYRVCRRHPLGSVRGIHSIYYYININKIMYRCQSHAENRAVRRGWGPHHLQVPPQE